jgi:hypothetical protein
LAECFEFLNNLFRNLKMSIFLEKTLIVSSLLPKSLVQGLQTEKKEENLGEASMCAVALLIVNAVLGATKVLKQRNYKSLDANPGDGGCQARALELRRLTMMDLKDECASLEKIAKEIKTLVNIRKGNPKERLKCTSDVFFQNNFGALIVSKEMEYILHCYLSTVLRTPYQTLSNGVVMTRSEMSRLSVLSDKITVLDRDSRRKIVEENQKTLSMLSVAAIHFSATQITSLESEEKKLMITMLSPEQTHLFTPDVKYEPKAFGCLFYEAKTVLIRLREEQGIVCLKSIVATGHPSYLLLQSKISGKEFEILPEEECTLLPSMTSVIVFEAVVNVGKEKAKELLEEHGFTNTILSQAAKEAPYEPTSRLDDVKVPEAVIEITHHKEKGVKIGDFVALDHVYLNTLGAEIKI